jgi:neuroligin
MYHCTLMKFQFLFCQRLGCVHGEDLTYVFGVPLFFYGNELGHGGGSRSGPGADSEEKEIAKLGYFFGNFSRNEVQLSQMVMGYWANFVRTGYDFIKV